MTASLKQAMVLLQNSPPFTQDSRVILDMSGLKILDTAGAYLIDDFCQKLKKENIDYHIKGFTPSHDRLFKHSHNKTVDCHRAVKLLSPELVFLGNLGLKTHKVVQESLLLLSFFGEVIINFFYLLRSPGSLKVTSVVFHLQRSGFQALPIVGLISFLIGVVLVYQGAQQLKRFGAEIFTIDLLAVSVLREIGVLLTSIVVAGRSGSAFTAQIGTMSLNQEIDAMRVMGLNPLQYLVIPRILALMIALPLLSFFANIVALLGGAVMGSSLIGIDFDQFFQHLNLTIKPWTFWAGMIKAPVFAFTIALVGCFEGMRVSGSAESAGRHTTQSVVKSIFLIIILDSAFSIIYSVLDI